MERHKIERQEMLTWLGQKWWQYAASHDAIGRTAKRFEVSWSGRCRVSDHGKTTYEGPNMDAAIEAYNSAE